MKFSSWLPFLYKIIALGVLIFCLLFQLGANPVGFFCDEAEIANVARAFLQQNAPDYFVAPFFYHHFNYTLGLLPILTTVPFIAVAQNEFTVRLASVVCGLLSLIFIALTLRRLKANVFIPLLMLGFSPLFFHVSRINFGHLPAFLCTTIGLWFFFWAKEKQRWFLFAASGSWFGLSAYGYGGYLAAAPLLVGILLFSEIVQQRWNLKFYRKLLLLVISFVLCISPIIFATLFVPEFAARFQDKTSELPSGKLANFARIVLNYPKYFSLDYLFVGGENTQAGALITRHSVTGNGIFLQTFLPIVLIAVFGWLFVKDDEKIKFLPFVLVFFLTPLPDLLTTNFNQPPYSFAVFFAQLCIPFLVAYAIRTVRLVFAQLEISQGLVLAKRIFISALIIDVGMFLGHYFYSYPLRSADFWGWQMGPKQIVQYFSQQQETYDAMFLTPNMNEPNAVLHFYNTMYACDKCFVGYLQDHYDPSKKQLFALTVEELVAISAVGTVTTHHTISYPDGTVAFYVVEFSEGN